MLDAGLTTLDLLKRLLQRFLKVESGKETPEYTPIALVYTGWAGPVVRISIGGRKA